MQRVGDSFSRHRFTGAAIAGEESADTEAAIHAECETPFFIDSTALAHLLSNLPKQLTFLSGKHDVVKSGFGRQALGQVFKVRPRDRPTSVPKLTADFDFIFGGNNIPGNLFYRGQIQIELTGKPRRIAFGFRLAQRGGPGVSLLSPSRFFHVEGHHAFVQVWPCIPGAEKNNSAGAHQKTVDRWRRLAFLWIGGIESVGIEI